jgi:hypothetical protein
MRGIHARFRKIWHRARTRKLQLSAPPSSAEDDKADGYMFFLNAKGEIVGLFAKGIGQSWGEDRDGVGSDDC